MASTTVTKLSKNKILEARAGIKALPAVTQMVFGDGADGTPSEDDSILKNGLLQRDLGSIGQMMDVNFRCICILSRERLANTSINEIALCDTEGGLVMIRTCLDKNKDDGKEMTFAFNDISQEAGEMANFEISEEQAALIQELRELETSDPVHVDVYNALFGKLINNNALLERLANKMIEKNMLCHVPGSISTQQVLAAGVGPKITKITDGLQKSISGLSTDLGNRFASRVADCNFLTEGKSETVMMAIWDNNTLNTPYEQGVSGPSNDFVIDMSPELAWAIQVAFAVSDANLFVRSYTPAGISWTGW